MHKVVPRTNMVVCGFVCVCVRERGRERKCVFVCMCLYVSLFVCVSVCVCVLCSMHSIVVFLYTSRWAACLSGGGARGEGDRMCACVRDRRVSGIHQKRHTPTGGEFCNKPGSLVTLSVI